MKSLSTLALLAGLTAAAGALAPSAATAQTEVPRVASHQNWSVFETNQGTRECWIASAPTESVARRNGQTVSVRRGTIMMVVSFRPAQGVANEVSFTGGYPFRADSRVDVEIQGTTFELFTEGEWAWPATPSVDGDLVAAMRRAGSAEVTGVSGRGTTTIDTISAIGFTAALNDARNRCS
ncbi:MAG: hypothetical protein AAGJ96_04645 [Pseudomonadota bacterium]